MRKLTVSVPPQKLNSQHPINRCLVVTVIWSLFPSRAEGSVFRGKTFVTLKHLH